MRKGTTEGAGDERFGFRREVLGEVVVGAGDLEEGGAARAEGKGEASMGPDAMILVF